MDWGNIIVALISAVCGGGGVFGIIKVREDKKKTPYDMVVEMLQEQKRFYQERNADYEREKRDSNEKSAVIMMTHRCKYKYADPNIVCPVDEANEQRLQARCERCEINNNLENQ